MTATEFHDPTLSAPDPTPTPAPAAAPAAQAVPPVAPAPAPARRFRLVKTRHGRKLFGVCAGIARELDVDVTLIRVAFVGAAFAGFGIPLYLAAAILAPRAEDERIAG